MAGRKELRNAQRAGYKRRRWLLWLLWWLVLKKCDRFFPAVKNALWFWHWITLHYCRGAFFKFLKLCFASRELLQCGFLKTARDYTRFLLLVHFHTSFTVERANRVTDPPPDTLGGRKPREPRGDQDWREENMRRSSTYTVTQALAWTGKLLPHLLNQIQNLVHLDLRFHSSIHSDSYQVIRHVSCRYWLS